MNRFDDASLRENRDFRRYYDLHLKPHEAAAQGRQTNAIQTSIKRGVASLALIAAFWIVGGGVIGFGDGIAFVSFAVTLMMLIGLGVWTALPFILNMTLNKSELMPRIVAYFGDFLFTWAGEADLTTYSDWGILPDYSRSHVTDKVTGSYRGVPIRFVEMKLVKPDPTSDEERMDTVFKGVLLEYRLRTPVAGTTVIVSSADAFSHVQKLREDDLFEPMPLGVGFEGHTTNPAAAASKADQRFLDQLVAIRDRVGGMEVMASWHADRLLILVSSSRNCFEAPHFEAVDFFRDAETVRDQLRAMVEPIEVLEIEPSLEPRDFAPRRLKTEEASGDPRFTAIGSAATGLGCLPTMAGALAGFALYGIVLQDVESRTAVFFVALFFGPMLAIAVRKSYDFLTKGEGGLLGAVFVLAIALGPIWYQYVAWDSVLNAIRSWLTQMSDR